MIHDHQLQPQASDGDYERLRHLGHFGLKVSRSYQYSEAFYPGGGYESALEGPSEGIQRVSLVWKVVADSSAQASIIHQGNEQTLALYLWEFFHRHKSPVNKPFICPHPFTEADLCWRFEEHSIALDHLVGRLWTTGLPLVQHFYGEPFTDTHENPQTI